MNIIMDLSKFVLGKDAEYTNRAKRDHALLILSDLADDKRITRECWEDLIKIGESDYLNTFTDDSGYVKGSMPIKLLNKHSSELRNMLLKRFYNGGNWIMRLHIEDFVKENNMPVIFKLTNIPFYHNYSELD
jgi:hypothetical protein